MPEFIPSSEGPINAAIRAAGGRALTLREIARALGPAAPRKAELRAAVRALEARGAIVRRRGNRWAAPAGDGRRTAATLRLSARGGWLLDDATGARVAAVRPEALNLALDGDRVLTESAGRPGRPRGRDRLPEARVLRVLERRREALTGLLQRTAHHWYVIPDDARIPWNVVVRGAGGVALREHRRVVIRLDPWAPNLATLSGTLAEDLGPADAPDARRRALHRRHGLAPEFPDDVRAESRRAPRAPAAADRNGRRDLREQFAITIDPADARDFDDAVGLRARPGGGWELDVHIADVSHYVPADSAIDREARARGTTTYLVDSAITMLPADLTTDVCSLQPEQDRLCHTARLHLAADGAVLGRETFPSLIRSRARLTYDEAQRVLEGGDGGLAAPLVEALREMGRVASLRRARRMAEGALDLTTPEVRFDLDADGGVTAIRPRGCDAAYHLIEEFMLLANEAVARTLSAAGVPALYRIHEAPDEEQWSQMEAALAELGLALRERTRAGINRLLAGVAGAPRQTIANLAVLRNLKRAVYSAHRAPHFGLALTHYTHFTSPIRRYPDLIVHRQLKALEEGRRPPYAAADLTRLAAHCSERERAADEAEADSVEEKRILYFARRLREGETGPFAAVVTGATARGPLVELCDSLQRGLLRPPPETGRRRGGGGARPLRLGDAVRVELVRVDERRRWVDFAPAR